VQLFTLAQERPQGVIGEVIPALGRACSRHIELPMMRPAQRPVVERVGTEWQARLPARLIDCLTVCAVPVGPLCGPLGAKAVLVVRGWPSYRCGAMVSRPVANIKALGSRVGMVGPVCAVGHHARDKIAELYAASVGSQNVIVLPSWASSPTLRLVWEQVGLPGVIRSNHPDIVRSPHYTMPLVNAGRRGPKRVVTLHDATFFSDPEVHLAVKARFFTQWTRFSCRHADALLVPSQATKDELVRAVQADPERIKVIPHGVDHERFRRPSADEVRAARTWLGLPAGATFIAFLGTLEPRKNVPGLIRAYALSTTTTSRSAATV
jgi:glycosyltransferase involved in cell wall biosynthesis